MSTSGRLATTSRNDLLKHPLPVREIFALSLLTVGSALFPFVGWLAGAVLVCGSRRFRPREKWAATLLLPGGLFTGFAWASWMADLTHFTCSAGTSAQTVGLAGPVVPDGVVTTPSACTAPQLPGWLGLLLLVVGLAVSVSGPLWAWHEMGARESARSRPDAPGPAGHFV